VLMNPYYVWEDYFLNGVYDEYEASTVGLYTGSALSSRISYKLNLTGPSVVVRAACATSLVSIHMACQSLLGYESDMAIVAASNIALNQDGYFATENTISPDGYTRAYDNNGQGFVPGNGTAAIILKRLSDATRDKDHIYAVIKGSSIGNDGNRKSWLYSTKCRGRERSNSSGNTNWQEYLQRISDISKVMEQLHHLVMQLS